MIYLNDAAEFHRRRQALLVGRFGGVIKDMMVVCLFQNFQLGKAITQHAFAVHKMANISKAVSDL